MSTLPFVYLNLVQQRSPNQSTRPTCLSSCASINECAGKNVSIMAVGLVDLESLIRMHAWKKTDRPWIPYSSKTVVESHAGSEPVVVGVGWGIPLVVNRKGFSVA